MFQADAKFVGRIEKAVPSGSTIFQLPYSRYPEPTMIHRMFWYEHFRAYLHSNTLRWTYGAMCGRYSDLWQAQVAARPVEGMARQLAFAGFGGIYIDRWGFVDDGRDLGKRRLSRRLATSPIVSDDQRFSFFDLTAYAVALQRELTPEDWAARRVEALSPVVASWGEGFFEPVKEADGTRRWSDGAGKITLVNPSNTSRRVDLTMTLATNGPAPSWVQVNGPGVKENYRNDATDRVVRKSLVVPPGNMRLGVLRQFGSGGGPAGGVRKVIFPCGPFHHSGVGGPVGREAENERSSPVKPRRRCSSNPRNARVQGG